MLSTAARPDPAPTDTPAARRTLRTIAVFEALKGSLALIAGVGVLGLLHRDLHQIATALIGHVGLSPGAFRGSAASGRPSSDGVVPELGARIPAQRLGAE